MGWVLAGRVARGRSEIARGWLEVEEAEVLAVAPGPPPPDRTVVDVGEGLIAPGFVDLHVHGGAGHTLSGATPAVVAEELEAIAAFHATHGTTALVATTVTEGPARLLAAAAGVALVRRRTGSAPAEAARRAEVLGLHLEGPWLAPSRAGAQTPEDLRRPSVAEFDELMAAAEGALRIVTIAPELEGGTAFVRHVAERGAVVSVGHTEANYEEVRRAIAAGARHLTHAGNAMAGIDRRRPGPLVAALLDPAVTLEVIADGLHVHPGLLQLLAAVAGPRLVLVTDAIAAAGAADGRYRLGRLDVVVEGGRASLADRPDTLAGSTLTMERAVRTLHRAGVGLPEALFAASGAPAAVLGLEGHKGCLSPGADADLVVLDEQLDVVATVVGGRVVHDPGGRFEAPGPPIG